MTDPTSSQSRLYLSYILAASVLELFPGTQLIENHVDDIGFSYEFSFLSSVSKNFSSELLIRIEDHMRMILSRHPTFRLLEMKRENAQEFFYSKEQPLKADRIASYPYNIVQLVAIDQFFDFCPNPLEVLEEKIYFKLLNFSKENNLLKIQVAAFKDKQKLKQFLKLFDQYSKYSFEKLGSELNLFLSYSEEEKIWLPKGLIFLDNLINFWKTSHEKFGFDFVKTPTSISPLKSHLFIFQNYYKESLPQRIAEIIEEPYLQEEELAQDASQIKPYKKDFASFYCSNDLLKQELISSLQFIQKTIKIFPFEFRLDVTRSKRAQKTEVLSYYNELPLNLEHPKALFQFYLLDRLGRGWKGPQLQVHTYGTYSCIQWSFWDSIENFASFLVEQMEGKLPFWLIPEQVRVIPIASQNEADGNKVINQLKRTGIRAFKDARKAVSLAEKIYDATKEKVPYLVLLGEKEKKMTKAQDEEWITVRSLNEKEQIIELNRWIEQLVVENKQFELEN